MKKGMAKKAKSIKELVDIGYQLDTEIKILQKELEEIKAKLKKACKKNKGNTIKGNEYLATFTDKNETIIDPYNLYEFMQSLKAINGKHWQDSFFRCITVNLKNAREVLQDKLFNIPNIKIKTKQKHCISFSK